jgi:hypothetical protein
MRRLLFCGLALSLLGLAAGCKFGGNHVAGVCDCGEAPVQPVMQPYGINAGPPAAVDAAAKQLPNAPVDNKQ